MSIAVARLVDRGYIHRTHGERDARSIELTLTPVGARVKEENSILEPLLVREIFKLMSPAELESSLKGVETLAKFAKILLRKRKREHDK
jgi:DNA-binding MarR family transcriptional regulator